jgi:hypothetical protein
MQKIILLTTSPPNVSLLLSKLSRESKLFSVVFIFLLCANSFVALKSFNGNKKTDALYLSSHASIYISKIDSFEVKVKFISEKLNIPPEWLMSVMYSESRFNSKAVNFKGSGAVGLIQFMPNTAKELGTTTAKIGKMTELEQLDFVFQYLDIYRKKYGEYKSLTDLYLAILYPKAREGEICFELYGFPSKAYKQNKGLDYDKNGSVTTWDIEKRMQRLYPVAYAIEKK